METPSGMVCIDSRRIGEKIWVLVTDFIPPTYNQLPEVEGNTERRNSYTRVPWLTWWTVPIDDANCMLIGYWYAREDEDRRRDVASGLRSDRPYEERQRMPGDYDAQVSQRPIEVHALEHLAATDRGIIMLRNIVKRGIKAVQEGVDPEGVAYGESPTVPTYSHDRVLDVPPAPTPEEDRRLIRETGRRIVEELIKDPSRALPDPRELAPRGTA